LQPGDKIYDPAQECYYGTCADDGKISFVPDPECDIECEAGKEYDVCGCHHTCTDLDYVCDYSECEPGCYCPDDMAWDGAECVLKEDCGCLVDGELMLDGTVIEDECNKCECIDGMWDCYEVSRTLIRALNLTS
jgi:hypothetical protein